MKYTDVGTGDNRVKLIAYEPARYAVEVVPDVFYHVTRQPNAWWRWWQYVLLGWKWSKLP